MRVEKTGRDGAATFLLQKPPPPIGSSSDILTHLPVAPELGSNVASDNSLVVHGTKEIHHAQDIFEMGWGTRKVEDDQAGPLRLRGLIGAVTRDVATKGSSALGER